MRLGNATIGTAFRIISRRNKGREDSDLGCVLLWCAQTSFLLKGPYGLGRSFLFTQLFSNIRHTALVCGGGSCGRLRRLDVDEARNRSLPEPCLQVRSLEEPFSRIAVATIRFGPYQSGVWGTPLSPHPTTRRQTKPQLGIYQSSRCCMYVTLALATAVAAPFMDAGQTFHLLALFSSPVSVFGPMYSNSTSQSANVT
jgi:hypothetical protein